LGDDRRPGENAEQGVFENVADALDFVESFLIHRLRLPDLTIHRVVMFKH
jgi:hypothetical protein